MLANVARYRKAETDGVIQEFCDRFGLEPFIEAGLLELNPDKACRLMQSFKPEVTSSQEAACDRLFDQQVDQALQEQRVKKMQKTRWQVGTAAHHATIIQEWSSDEDEEDEENQYGEKSPDQGGGSAAASTRWSRSLRR